MKDEKLIKVCDYCGKPIFYTFIFIGAEWYCPSCGASGDIFFGKEVKATEKLLKLEKSLKKKFLPLKKHLAWGGGARKEGCRKCKFEPHIRHLTKEEKRKYEWARKRLKMLYET